jgi:hypothetical protein
MKSKEELLEMADELNYAQLFEELDRMGLKGEIYETLKTEFMLNKTDIHWNNRLKMLIGQFFLNPNLENIPSEKAKIIQNADKIYNIDKIDNANFS